MGSPLPAFDLSKVAAYLIIGCAALGRHGPYLPFTGHAKRRSATRQSGHSPQLRIDQMHPSIQDLFYEERVIL